MKKLILVFLFLGLSLSSWGKEPPTGFWGVDFGATPEKIKEIMAQKDGIELKSDFLGVITYKGVGGVWSDERIDWLSFRCHNNMMISAMVSLKPTTDVLFLFDEMVDKLNTRYYRTKKVKRTYRSPFYAGDGHDLLAISEGYATISALWTFKEAKISAIVSESLTVSISYEDTPGMKLWLNQIGMTGHKDAEMNDL